MGTRQEGAGRARPARLRNQWVERRRRIGREVGVDGVVFGYEDGEVAGKGVDVHVTPGRTIAVVGTDRLWQVHHRQPAVATRRSARRGGEARRPRPARAQARSDPPECCPRVPGVLCSTTQCAATSRSATTTATKRSRLPPSWPRPTASSAAPSRRGDTVVGERGTTLSGGQRQRVRWRGPREEAAGLVMDDAPSSVDPTVEQDILRGPKEAELPFTVVVIAYRRATIAFADEGLPAARTSRARPSTRSLWPATTPT